MDNGTLGLFAAEDILQIPNGGGVAYVHHNYAALDDLSSSITAADRGIKTTLNGGYAGCRSNRGDRVIVLPGHDETLGTADALSSIKAGTRVRGVGFGEDRPKFHWSVAASTVLVDVASVWFDNLILNLAGDPTLTTAITGAATGSIQVSAAGFRMSRCKVNTGVDADQIITIGLISTAAGDDMTLEDNFFYNSATTADIPNGGALIRLVGADRAVIRRNYLSSSFTTVTDPVLEFVTTASKDIVLEDNFIYANGSDNTVCVKFADVATSGKILRNLMKVPVDATAQTTILSFAGTTNLDMTLLDNFIVNNKNERGLVAGTASA